MTTTTSSTASSTSALAAQINASSSGSSAGTASSTKAMSDQFLKLLITQIQNQDPLNPTDNAQFTSQLAQINTVSGLEKVNESISSMSSQFLQMQAMQSASLVGRSVIVPGNALTVSDGKATGQFELGSAADSVKVDVLSSAGRVIDTIDLGAETSGRQQFSWTPAEGVDTTGLRFRVSATRGTAAVSSTALQSQQITSVAAGSSGSASMNLTLKDGSTVAYSAVRAFGS
ncbi:flagellar hook capping protein [Sphaerotilus natans subsp. natans DSM 6575]|jgi:flagellar basal-body rod modification protein FlgD|uniref:Basal-body rod modification protein FlgD n=1 Tax=Sphaerotilus natans subsp. natans DSM 6575 TaxID=1286631 RepID=A0A059KQY3_9BURK|nr:flagellar hook capping FlgD N-terminal domain-containing protein [Sphaerotilus natans]KDB53846.1 flagellar hook capping protein [Sphaerotilus natans subsp. natans DSM 6575]SIR56631.1 flagellar basal-body rod modification protein FlgD [Sphaerotilus natans]